MEIKLIRNDDDYQNTLKEIESLWESPINTPEGDRLELLITMIEEYDAEHYPPPVINDPI